MTYVDGLEMSADTGSYTSLVISAFKGVVQSSEITLERGIIKSLASSWSSGDGGGMLDQGSMLASTAYHLFAIGNPWGGTDILASTSPLNPDMPDGFDRKVPIGAIITNAGCQITPFRQLGGVFGLVTPNMLWGGEAISAVPKLLSTGAPTGVKTEVEIFMQVSGNSAPGYLCISDPDLGNAEIYDAAVCYNVGASGRAGTVLRVWTDTLGRVSICSNTAATLGNCFLRGWTDPRLNMGV